MKQFKPWYILAVVDSVVVDGALKCYALLHFIYDSKDVQMNVQHSLIQEFMFYEFELGYSFAEASKTICYAKDESTVDHNTDGWCLDMTWYYKW